MGSKIMCLFLVCISIQNNFARFPTDPFSPDFGRQLQAQIQAQVDAQLAPVRQMERNLKIGRAMTHGIGGITVAIYGGEHRLIFIDGDRYSCPAEILLNRSKTSVFCTKPLTSRLSKEQKLCGLQSFSRMNDVYCIGENISFNCNNNVCHCHGGTKYSLSQMKKICGPTFGTSEYTIYYYYPNKASRHHIEIPNEICEEVGKNVCIWTKHNVLWN